jgi:hypothetical protein
VIGVNAPTCPETRLAISHIVVPLHPAEFVASQVATVVVRYLGHEPPPTE